MASGFAPSGLPDNMEEFSARIQAAVDAAVAAALAHYPIPPPIATPLATPTPTTLVDPDARSSEKKKEKRRPRLTLNACAEPVGLSVDLLQRVLKSTYDMEITVDKYWSDIPTDQQRRILTMISSQFKNGYKVHPPSKPNSCLCSTVDLKLVIVLSENDLI